MRVLIEMTYQSLLLKAMDFWHRGHHIISSARSRRGGTCGVHERIRGWDVLALRWEAVGAAADVVF